MAHILFSRYKGRKYISTVRAPWFIITYLMLFYSGTSQLSLIRDALQHPSSSQSANISITTNTDSSGPTPAIPVYITETLPINDPRQHCPEFAAERKELDDLNRRGTWTIEDSRQLYTEANILRGSSVHTIKNSKTSSPTSRRVSLLSVTKTVKKIC